MSQKFTQAFKIQAVEKALSRAEGVSVIEIAESLGIGYSTLQKWIVKSKNHEFEPIQPMTKEKRPQDWNKEERLNMVIECGSLSEEEISELCRTQGLYPHHIKQWKEGFSNGTDMNAETNKQTETKKLRNEIRYFDAENEACEALIKKVSRRIEKETGKPLPPP